MITKLILLLLIVTSVFAQEEEVVCGPETLNAGWTVANTWSFDLLTDCCDEKVKNWKVASETGPRPFDTGCTKFLQNCWSSRVPVPFSCFL